MDREGHRADFVRYRSLKTRQKMVSDMESHLGEEGGEAWMGVGARLHRKVDF